MFLLKITFYLLPLLTAVKENYFAYLKNFLKYKDIDYNIDVDFFFAKLQVLKQCCDTNVFLRHYTKNEVFH